MPRNYTGATARLNTDGRRLWSLGWTDGQIADELDCTKRQVCTWRQNNGLRTKFTHRRPLDDMTIEQWRAYQESPRQCRGPCGRLLTVANFNIMSERGRKVLRAKCRRCMSSRNEEAAPEPTMADVERTITEQKAKCRCKAKVRYFVVDAGSVWEVHQSVDEWSSEVVSTHSREQDAEREVRGLLSTTGRADA